MASVLYPDYKESCLGGGTHSFSDLTEAGSDVIKCALVNLTDDYTYSAAHVDKADVTSYGASTDQTLASKTVTVGVFDAADLTFTAVVLDVSACDALVHFKDDTGTAATSPLICYHDGFSAVTPNSGDITVSYSASGIFAL